MRNGHGASAGAGGPAATDRGDAVGFGRGHGAVVRVLALLGLLSFGFILVFVADDAAGRVGVEQALEAPGSPEARAGAERPGEAVHLTGALAALGIGAGGLLGLMARPQRVGSAHHAAASSLGMLLAIALVGDPDNYGGQAGPVDMAFLVMAVPPLAAAVAARPWRGWRTGGRWRPRFLLLAVLALPALWYGAGQASMQRNTWPPLADPHHQAHWYAMAVLAFTVVLVLAAAALPGRGWRPAAVAPGVAAVAVGGVSLLAPTAASALAPAWAVAAGLWGMAVLAVAWSETRSGRA